MVKLSLVLLLSIGILHVVEGQTPIRVACRLAQPPFDNAPSIFATRCEGLFAEAFYRIMESNNIPYTMDMLNVSSLDSSLVVNSTGGSRYDMIISFHTVTPTRLAIHDFSVAVFQDADMVALSPKYAKPTTSLVSSVIRDSVLYMWCVLMVLAAGAGVVIFIAESLDSESCLHEVPLWRRPLWCAEMGLEIVLSSGTSEDLHSQISRSLRSVVALMAFFVLTIFGSVITSQLTASSLSDTSVSVTDLRGAKLAIASSTLVPYLTSFSVGATVVNFANLEDFAREFYAGNMPDFDGFCTSTPVVRYFHHQFDGDAKGFVLSNVFYKTGPRAEELKAFPFSRACNQTFKALFDRNLQELRESGALAELIVKYLAPEDPPAPDDLPIDGSVKTTVNVLVAVVYSLLGLVVVVLFVIHMISPKEEEEPKVVEGTVQVNAPANSDDFKRSPTAVQWKEQAFDNVDETHRKIIRAILEDHIATRR